GAHGDGLARRALLRALHARALGPLHDRLLLRGCVELRPSPVRGQVPAGAGLDDRGHRGNAAQLAPVQREDARRRGRVAAAVPLRVRHALRAALRRRRAEPGRDRLRDAGVQVSADWIADSRTRRLATAGILALLLGGAAVQLGEHAYRTMPHPHALEELSYFP